MLTAYTIFLLRTSGNLLFAIACLAAAGVFLWHRGPNGINRLTGLFLFCLFLRSVSIAYTGMIVLFTRNIPEATLNYYYWPWTQETLTTWIAVVALGWLAVYLIIHRGQDAG